MGAQADRVHTLMPGGTPLGDGGPLVVLLHGFMGETADLEPFARSLGIDARFAFPPGLVDLASRGLRGRAWWPIDIDARAAALSRGPRDLSGFFPEGLGEARAFLGDYLDVLSRDAPDRPLVLGGFSQGAMLSCDLALRTPRSLAGLVVFSGARIAATDWAPLYSNRSGLPVFVSHGRRDDDLSFSAAESFQADLSASGWQVTWCPFDGGHEIPLVVWRSFKRWLGALSAPVTSG
jgi:phospholipase/carboxylesterase